MINVKRSHFILVAVGAILFVFLVYLALISSSRKVGILNLGCTIENSIICEPILITGYEWEVLEEFGNTPNSPQYCIISGADPESELNLGYEFMSANNRFIFYVADKRMYFSDELGETVTEYVVDGWDILLPVKHGNLMGDLLFPFGILGRGTEPRGR